MTTGNLFAATGTGGVTQAAAPAMLTDPKLVTKPVKQYTLVLVLDHSPALACPRILLGYKKAGFGAHKYNGFGGKVERSDKSVRAAAARELHEESGIWVPDTMLVRAGTLVFDFVDGGSAPPYILHVSVFTLDWQPDKILALPENQATRSTSGQASPVVPPFETDEMIPRWFDTNAIPFADMWPDDELWFPALLAGTPFRGQMWFAADQKTILRSYLEQGETGAEWDRLFLERVQEQEARGVFV